MYINTSARFHKIALHADGIQLNSKANSSDLIPYKTIEKIYLTTKKKDHWATYLYLSLIGLCVLLGIYCYSFMVLMAIILFFLLGIIFFSFKYWMNWNVYPSCQLVIVLKNGNRFTKKIAPAYKSETVDLINRIKKQI